MMSILQVYILESVQSGKFASLHTALQFTPTLQVYKFETAWKGQGLNGTHIPLRTVDDHSQPQSTQTLGVGAELGGEAPACTDPTPRGSQESLAAWGCHPQTVGALAGPLWVPHGHAPDDHSQL